MKTMKTTSTKANIERKMFVELLMHGLGLELRTLKEVVVMPTVVEIKLIYLENITKLIRLPSKQMNSAFGMKLSAANFLKFCTISSSIASLFSRREFYGLIF